MVSRVQCLTGLLAVAVVFFLCPFGLIYAQDLNDASSEKLQGKRSCIQDVDGYAFLSENMTLSETREAAFVNAKRQALEMTKTYIQSKTTIQNLELVEDRIDASAQGAVTIIEQKDFGVESNTRYHVWIKAEVTYGIKMPSQAVGVDSGMDEASPLSVNVWTSKAQYTRGEQIEIFLKGNIDFYARVVDISSSGNIVQLLPNAFRQDNLFRAGITYKIPDTSDKFKLTVTPPYGVDKIVVYASDHPLGPVPMEAIGNGLGRFRGTKGSLALKTRGIAVTQAGRGTPSIAQFYEGTCAITTRK